LRNIYGQAFPKNYQQAQDEIKRKHQEL